MSKGGITALMLRIQAGARSDTEATRRMQKAKLARMVRCPAPSAMNPSHLVRRCPRPILPSSCRRSCNCPPASVGCVNQDCLILSGGAVLFQRFVTTASRAAHHQRSGPAFLSPGNKPERQNRRHQASPLDHPPSHSIPPPRRLFALQMNSAQPSVNAIQLDVVRAAFNHTSASFRDRDHSKRGPSRV